VRAQKVIRIKTSVAAEHQSGGVTSRSGDRRAHHVHHVRRQTERRLRLVDIDAARATRAPARGVVVLDETRFRARTRRSIDD
jgi:hypothetical protein